MRRRDLLGGTLAAAIMGVGRPLRSQSQLKRVALVHPSEQPEKMTIDGRRTFKMFFSELMKLGYVEGKSVAVERYSALGRQEQYGSLARAVVDSHPDVIVSLGGPIARQLQPLTTTIPIITATSDPVVAGYAKSLAKPGGNITGVSVDAGVDLYGKRLQLLRETIPDLKEVRFLVPQSNLAFWQRAFGLVRRVALEKSLSLELAVVSGDLNPEAYKRLFDTLVQDKIDGLLVADASENLTHRKLIADLAAHHRIPAAYPYRESVELGGLISYGVDLGDVTRLLADMTVEVLKGANPADMPFYQPTKFELVLNRMAARGLGVTFPASLLATADEVIE